MKLASLRSGRDGRLIVVSRDLCWYCDAGSVAPTLQAALDNWSDAEPRLRLLDTALHAGDGERLPFAQDLVHSPLPRAFQWADGSAYVNHVALVRKARGAELPENFWHDPLMYQGGSDAFAAPHDPIELADARWGMDFEAEVVVVTDDVARGCTPAQAAGAILLVGLCNDTSLRHLIPGELAKGFGFFQSKPASSFAPVFVTPDELGSAWDGRKLHGTLSVDLNGRPFGRTDAGTDMTFDFGKLAAHAARTRTLGAGSIIGSGTVSNRDPDGGPGKPAPDGGRGYSCIAEIRMIETLRHGAPVTPFLEKGDRVEIWMSDESGASIFGTIRHDIV